MREPPVGTFIMFLREIGVYRAQQNPENGTWQLVENIISIKPDTIGLVCAYYDVGCDYPDTNKRVICCINEEFAAIRVSIFADHWHLNPWVRLLES